MLLARGRGRRERSAWPRCHESDAQFERGVKFFFVTVEIETDPRPLAAPRVCREARVVPSRDYGIRESPIPQSPQSAPRPPHPAVSPALTNITAIDQQSPNALLDCRIFGYPPFFPALELLFFFFFFIKRKEKRAPSPKMRQCSRSFVDRSYTVVICSISGAIDAYAGSCLKCTENRVSCQVFFSPFDPPFHN